MKTIFTFLMGIFAVTSLCAQTFTRGTIDTDILSKGIQQKQEQFIKRALADLVVKDQLGIANYATYNTLYNITYALGYSNNKQEIQRVIERELTLYAITYGIANAIIHNKSADTIIYENFLEKINNISNIENEKNTILQRLSIDTTDDKMRKDTIKKINEYYKKYYENIYVGMIHKNEIKYKKYYMTEAIDIIIDSIYFKIYKNKNLLEKYGLKFSEIVVDSDVKILDNRWKNLKNRKEDSLLIKKSMVFFDSFYVKTKKLDSLLAHYKIDNVTQLTSAENLAELCNALRDFLKPYLSTIPSNQLMVTIIGSILDNITFSKDTIKGGARLSYEIDVESIIVTLTEKYNNSSFLSIKYNWVGVEPLALIGITKSVFANPDSALAIPGIESGTSTLTFAGEKLGLRFVFADFGYSRSFKPGNFYWYRGSQRQWTEPVRATYFNKAYGMVYASGVAYSLFNLSSQKNFNSILIGAGVGVTAFNDLSLNFSYAVPLLNAKYPDKKVESFLNKGLWCLSFDIPIVEYVQALTQK